MKFFTKRGSPMTASDYKAMQNAIKSIIWLHRKLSPEEVIEFLEIFLEEDKKKEKSNPSK